MMIVNMDNIHIADPENLSTHSWIRNKLYKY